MSEILYTPDRERVVSSNAWAFLHWLRWCRGVELGDWPALVRWSSEHPGPFCAAIGTFAGRMGTDRLPLPDLPRSEAEGRAVADRLLFADLRPDDRLHDASTGAIPPQTTVLIAPMRLLADIAFQHTPRLDLPELRCIVAIGGPLSPQARRRIYTWVKPDVLLLARAGNTYWGNPLEPVLARPPASPAFLTPPPSAPQPR